MGIAYKGYSGRALEIELPGNIWNRATVVTNLVAVVRTVIIDGKLHFTLQTGPMELNALHIN